VTPTRPPGNLCARFIVEDLRSGDGDGRGRSVPAGHEAGGNEHPVDRVLPTRQGDPRRHDSRRSSPHPGHTSSARPSHAGRRRNGRLQLDVRLQPRSPAVITPEIASEFDRALQNPCGRFPATSTGGDHGGPVRHAGEVREAQGRPAQLPLSIRELHLEADVQEAIFNARSPSRRPRSRSDLLFALFRRVGQSGSVPSTSPAGGERSDRFSDPGCVASHDSERQTDSSEAKNVANPPPHPALPACGERGEGRSPLRGCPQWKSALAPRAKVRDAGGAGAESSRGRAKFDTIGSGRSANRLASAFEAVSLSTGITSQPLARAPRGRTLWPCRGLPRPPTFTINYLLSSLVLIPAPAFSLHNDLVRRVV